MIQDLPGNDSIDEDLEVLFSRDQWQEVSAILQKRAGQWVDEGQVQRLKRWLDRLPVESIAETPWLLFWSGIVRLSARPHESRKYFEQSFGLFEDRHHIVGMFAAWSGIADSILYTWDDFNGLHKWIKKFAPIGNYYALIPSRTIKARVSVSMFAALMYCQPYHRDMTKWTRRAVAAVKSSLHPTQRMLINHQLVTYFVWNGEFSKANLIINHLNREADFDDAAPMAQITHALVEAIYTVFAEPDSRACHQAVSRGLKLAEETGSHLWDGQLLAQGAWGDLMQGDAEGAEHYLARMNTLLNPERRFEYSLYHNQRGWQALLRRDLPLAMEHTQEALRLAKVSGVVGAHAFNHQAIALILLEMGEYEQAQQHLDRAIEIGRGRKSGLLTFFKQFLLAQALFHRGRNDQALSKLRQGLEMGRKHDFWTTPWWHAPTMGSLCQKALDANIEVKYVQKLIRRHHLIPNPMQLGTENWPWLLKVQTMGGFALQIDGEPYQPVGKAPQKPLELLMALIAMGNHGFAYDQISDVLWPDAEGDKARRALFTTLHRLRKLLGHEDAVLIQQHRLVLNPRCCWVDVWVFEQLVEKLDSALAGANALPDKISRLTDRLLSLYQGEFLPGETEIWALSRREHLRDKFLHLLMALAGFWEQRSEWDRAVKLYHDALETDKLAEEYYQGLMLCQLQAGRRAEALTTYQRCQENLSVHLGISPSRQTKAIHDQVLNSR